MPQGLKEDAGWHFQVYVPFEGRILHSFGLGAMMLGFEITRIILTSCQTHPVQFIGNVLRPQSVLPCISTECFLEATALTQLSNVFGFWGDALVEEVVLPALCAMWGQVPHPQLQTATLEPAHGVCSFL